LHFVVLADDSVDANVLDVGRGAVQVELVSGQPVVVEVRVLLPDGSDYLVHEVVHQVLEIVQSSLLAFLVAYKACLVLLEFNFGLPELGCHLVVPLFDAIQDTRVPVVLVLADLLLSLFYLFLFELGELREVFGQFLDL